MTLDTGTRISRYEIVGLLGAGGMGEVYRARDPQIGRSVAIKVLPAAVSSDPARLARFEQEARAAGALNHPNVVAVYDVGTDAAAPFIVAELLDGQTLRALVDGGPPPVRAAVDYAAQIARGLAAAHARGIVHRDLKPENAFLTSDGRVKILDFGLAKLAAPDEGAPGELMTQGALTGPGLLLGTVGYMAPEQVRGAEIDHRVDIFALGCILYEMLAGRRAFAGASPIETLNAILNTDPAELPSASAGSPALERIVQRCLEKNPALRFQSASDLAFALESIAGTATSSGVTTIAVPNRPWTTWRIVPWLLVVLSIAALAWSLIRTSQPAARTVRFQVDAPGGGAFQWFLGFSSAVSPDGRWIALVVTSEGRRKLFLRALDATDAQPVASADGGEGPFWSPDSRSLGFVADGKLQRVDIGGGPPRTICPAAEGTIATWGAAGTIVFRQDNSLFRVDAVGGVPTLVAKPDAARQETGLGWPYFLPDGRHFLYVVWRKAGAYEPVVGSLDSHDVVRLTGIESRTIYAPPGYLLFVRDGTLLAQRFDVRRLATSGDAVPVAIDPVYFNPTGFADLSVSDNGVLAYLSAGQPSRLVWRSRSGAELGTVGEPNNYTGPRLSPDGKRLAVNIAERRTGSPDVWVFDLASGTSSKATFDPGPEWGSAWSPDSRRLAFAAPGGGPPNLHVKAIGDTGTGEALVPPSNAAQLPWDWANTTAGEILLYAEAGADARGGLSGSVLDIGVVSLSDRRTRSLMQTRFDETEARVSPNGRWVAFVSNQSGTREVYVKPLAPGSDQWPISTHGGVTPTWRRDGRELFYLASDGNVMSVAVNDRDRFSAGRPVPLFHAEPPRHDYGRYDVTPDGQRFITKTGGEGRAVTVVLNWTSGLPR